MKNILAILLLTVGISANAGFTANMTPEQLTSEVNLLLSMEVPPSAIVAIAKKNKVDVVATLIELGVDPTSALPATAAGNPSTNTPTPQSVFSSFNNLNVVSRASSFNSVGRGNSVSPN